MAILAAAVETNGWVLRLDVTGSPGSFTSYTLDPDGTPRLTLASDHAGFAPSGGQAVATTLSRALIGTRPLRVAAEVVGTALQAFRIDEVDLGGGVVRVRIALTEHIYSSDTNLTLAVNAGWRTGEAAESGIVVTNNSTVVAPIPIFRWALPQLSVVTGSFRLSLLVFSHHPNGFQPVAGVRFTVTDGTNIKTAWPTALATDNSMGDNLRCYTLEIDPATATALTAGLLRCDAEVYPWLGAMRSTDTAGTRSMTNLRAQGVSLNANAPFVVGYDPAGTRYSAMWAFVDPVNGTTTPAVGMVQASLVLAKAVAPGSRPRDINTATQAGFLTNRTLAAANGQASTTRSVDGMRVVLAAGTHGNGAGAGVLTFGVNAQEIPVRIIGDPDDANPRANCIVQVSGTNAISRVQRVQLQRFTLEIGGASITSTNQEQVIIDDCTVRGRSGFETNSSIPFGGNAQAGTWNVQITRSRWWRSGSNIGQSIMWTNLVRNCEHSRLVTVAQCAVKNRVMPLSEDATIGSTPTLIAYSGWATPTLAGQAEDVIIAHNDIRSWGGRVWGPSVLAAATAGTVSDSVRRQVFVGNICERIGNDPQPFYSIGEGTLQTISYNIIEGNTFVGERSNTHYSDPPAATLAQVNTSLNQAFVNRVAGNVFDWLPTKHDDFNSPAAAATRVANSLPNHGFRPQMVAGWSMLYGVGHEANVDMSRTGAANFRLQYSGRRSLTGYAGALTPGYSSDRSKLGTGTGGGDYRLLDTSPALRIVLRGQCDVDFIGTSRSATADAGAFQTASIILAPAGARSVQSAQASGVSPIIMAQSARSAMTVQSPAIALTVGLLPATARSGHRSAPSAVDWQTALQPIASLLPHRAEATISGWHVTIGPSATVLGHHVTATDLRLGLLLVPGSATLGLASTLATLGPDVLLTITAASSRVVHTAATTLLLPATASRATVTVAADLRSLIPNRN